jgi:uncharacterized membrane-anchored protein
MNKHIKLSLIMAIGLQFLILIGIYTSAALPLWTGTEIRVQTMPVDPRSLFRGNYARLRYEFSTIDADLLPDKSLLRHGEVIYISFEEGNDAIFEASAASLIQPKSGIFLRGRVENKHFYTASSLRVNYGIEAFFAPKEKALKLESELRSGAIAVLMVSSSGKARLKEIVAE